MSECACVCMCGSLMVRTNDYLCYLVYVCVCLYSRQGLIFSLFFFFYCTGVHPPSSSFCTSLIPPPPSTNLFHRSSCHKRHHTKEIILCSCTHHPYLQHKINGTNNTPLLCTIDRCTHSNINMKPISEHSTSSLNDSTSSPTTTSNDDESGQCIRRKRKNSFSIQYVFIYIQK